jgi:hypothetical protein
MKEHGAVTIRELERTEVILFIAPGLLVCLTELPFMIIPTHQLLCPQAMNAENVDVLVPRPPSTGMSLGLAAMIETERTGVV